MVKIALKTAQNTDSVAAFIENLHHPRRKEDAKALLKLFKLSTKLSPKMWGSSIIGYGRYHYTYESGREGEFFLTGFSPRKSNLSIYILPGYDNLDEMLSRLGKHKIGKSCLYINKLSDIDIAVLQEIIVFGLKNMRQRYQTFDE